MGLSDLYNGAKSTVVSPDKRIAQQEGDSTSVLTDGSLEYTQQQGGNGSLPSYQEATGAPVERDSPLGYNVGWFTVIILNISKMIGTGVFSTPASIYKSLGSVGLSMIYWALGLLISGCSLAIFLEFASYFPNRSGSQVVYLEQAFPRPKYFFPIAFAVQEVILSFSSGNSIVLAQYLFQIGNHEPSDWELKGLAVGGYTVAVLFVLFNTRFSMWLSNAIGIVKVITLIFISITGLVVLGGNTSVPDPHANFRDSFDGSTGDGYGIANALVKINFAYAGFENAFNVVGEVKNPVKTLRKSAPIALFIVAVLYIFVNIAYFAAVPKADIATSKQIAASLFFANVFGTGGASRALNALIALSAFGNLIAVLIGTSRMIRECGRQGVLPFPAFWANTKPFGTPFGPYFIKWAITILMILAPPAGDAFNFIVDLQSYPSNIFLAIMTIGLYIIRRQRSRLGLGRSEFRAWNAAVIFSVAVNIFLLVMPWYPPEGGATGGDVSFWYATYCAVGLGILLVCAIYYVFWIYLLPRWGDYAIRQEVLLLDNGAQSHRLVKVPTVDLKHWDSEHDPAGRLRKRVAGNNSSDEIEKSERNDYDV